ncbi:AAA family ATPase [Actinocrinis puniceicyclus]|uniref:AAA family ATPase n=1 Tax=Actinocrinis puniceicyclus TaxID=977794 RepID=A0A8J7WKD9_9ACTN|nr:ATP-binding protein [Actinocrinis puniceicyclus]MBS2961737.1 AAA family ATPase [Actinocrinis puniceicyclus]
MLVSFRVSNHRSLRDEQQLNLAPVFAADRAPGTKWPAVPVAAIFGANASGKSNLIDALLYFADLALESDRRSEPGYSLRRHPFALDPALATQPSWFDADAVIDGTRYTYGFGVDDDGVVEEWLHRYPTGRRQIVFERSRGDFRFGTTIRTNLQRASDITPPSILFLTSAARFELADVQPVYRWLRQIQFSQAASLKNRTVQYRLVELLNEPNRRRQVLDLLSFADFGIADIEVEEPDAGTVRAVQVEAPRVAFRMKGAEPGARLTLGQQSTGTITFLMQLAPVLSCLEAGSVMLIDELESNLHPNLAARIVALFQDPRVNLRGAQLIFTTHNTSLLGSNNEILKRDQIYFVEKKHQTGASVIYPLSDFKPRDKENTERRYLGGSYGAVPFIDDEAALLALTFPKA